jgi:hypothetical protein
MMGRLSATARGEDAGVLYKLLGLVTWKVIRLYLRRKAPTRGLAVAAVAAGLAAVAAVAAARMRGSSEG